MDAGALRLRAADLLERAKCEQDLSKHWALLERVVALIAKARELDSEKD
jgi:hypothetical protein